MSADAGPAVQTDGRTARRDRNREAVLDAVIDLFGEDAMFPAPAQVAERSGVSRRSVQRYFVDSEALARAAMERQLDRARPLFELDGLGEGPLEGRVERLVASRVKAYEVIAPVMRAALVRARSTPLVQEQLAPARRNLLLQVWVMFEPELDGRTLQEQREVASAVDLLLAFEAVEHLRHDRGLSAAATRRTLVRGALAIVRSPADGPGAPASAAATDPVRFTVVPPDDERAVHGVEQYVAELGRRFPQGFDLSTAHPAPLDLCVLAERGGEAVAVGGLVLRAGGVGEVKRMWVASTARGLGVGRRLLTALEDEARARGCTVVRLDTNEVLTEAIRLYETSGYRAVEPFNEDPYPTHFFQKDL